MNFKIVNREKLDFCIAVRTDKGSWVEMFQEIGTCGPEAMAKVRALLLELATEKPKPSEEDDWREKIYPTSDALEAYRKKRS